MVNHTYCRIPARTGYFSVTIDCDRLINLSPVAAPSEPVEELWLTPGLFDIQVNGMLGYDLSGEDLSVSQVVEIEQELERRGVTRWCPTVITQDPVIVERNLNILRSAIEENAVQNVHCIHLEGHYISAEDGYRGVHMKRWVRDPDPEEFDRWQAAAGGHIGLFSLAPEREGALEFIHKLKLEGVKTALVHHNAGYEKIRSAIANGADLATHLVNGCASMIHRQHNVIWAQLSLDDLWASFIADGYHIPHYTLRAVIRAKGKERSILVSDLAHLSGLPEGEYIKNGLTVVLKDGGLWVKGEGTNLLSGAIKTLNEGCEYLAVHAGFTIEEALVLASLNPARYMGVEHKTQLYPGYKGPLVLFSWKDQKLTIKKVHNCHG